MEPIPPTGFFTEMPPNTKPLSCLTRKAAPGILSEPGLPGHHRKEAYEGPTARHAVGPFYFPTGCVGIISRVGGECKEYRYRQAVISSKTGWRWAKARLVWGQDGLCSQRYKTQSTCITRRQASQAASIRKRKAIRRKQSSSLRFHSSTIDCMISGARL